MKHFDTLAEYDALIEKGFDNEKAHALVKNMDNCVKDFIADFASNKTVTLFGSIIILLAGFILASIWSLSLTTGGLERRMQSLETDMKSLENRMKNLDSDMQILKQCHIEMKHEDSRKVSY